MHLTRCFPCRVFLAFYRAATRFIVAQQAAVEYVGRGAERKVTHLCDARRGVAGRAVRYRVELTEGDYR